MDLRPVDFAHPAVVALLEHHVREARRLSPPGLSFALDLSGLQTPDITFLAAWDGDQLMGFGALKALSSAHGEIKSMRTAPEHVRKGVAAVLLTALLDLARAKRMTRVSLETGDGDAYLPARTLYERQGFVEGAAFADYEPTPFNRFFHLDL